MPLLETKGAGSAQGFGLSLGSEEPNYIEEVFSTYLYAGNDATQTITNNIDLSTKGGLVWTKQRTGTQVHVLVDTVRGNNKRLQSNSTAAEDTTSSLMSFNSDGYDIPNSYGILNSSGHTYASWTFRKQKKFFDIVTYTGDGTNRTVAHNLGSVPGCIIVKRTDTTGDWQVYHRANTANPETDYLVLNSSAATADSNTRWNDTLPTDSVFSLGTEATVNASGGTYVAYLFAHDAGGFGLAGTDNVISCGSYVGNSSSSGPVVSLGWEPQWVMVKNASSTSDWSIFDNMRGMPATANATQRLKPNTAEAESTLGGFFPTATGFEIKDTTPAINASPDTFIYIAIRRGPMKVPTDGTSVYNAITYTGDGTANRTVSTTIQPDLLIQMNPSGNDHDTIDRLRGVTRTLYTNLDYADDFNTNVNKMLSSMTNTGFVTGSDGANYWNASSISKGAWAFRRAPGFFDEVCYTGNGINGSTQSHNLGVAPEMWIVKRRSTADYWVVGTSARGSNVVELNSAGGEYDATTAYFSNGSVYTAPTSSVIWLGSNARVNQNGGTFVSYLFATVAGVSKVGSYTGNGSSQTIACGFAAGSRFVMIKRTDSTGDWYVWDSARGIVAGNDPHLSLNTTAAEVATDDSVDTDNSGFIVNQVAATNVNVSSATYIFLAIA